MVAAQHPHQLVLGRVDILKLVDHDVLEPFLPFPPDLRVPVEDAQRELDQIVVVEGERLLLMVQVAVEDDLLRLGRLVVFALERVQRHVDHVEVVVGLFEQLLDLDHVPGAGKAHVPQGQAAVLVDLSQDVVDVAVVEHQKAGRVPHRVDILPQDRDAKAVEGVDVAHVVVAGQVVDARAHLVRGLV